MEVPIYYNEEEEWQRALLLYDAVLKEICTKIEILNNEFKLAHQYNPIEHISSRIKSADSIARKMRINNRELTVEMAKSMLDEGIDFVKIMKVTGLTEDELLRLQDEAVTV